MRKAFAVEGFALVAIFGALCTGSADAKATYIMIDAGLVTGINSFNSVTGYNTIDGFVRTADGTVTTFDVSGAQRTEPTSINDGGAIAGGYLDSSGIWRGFARAADGTITTFAELNATYTQASAINNKGEITGVYSDGDNNHGFVRTDKGKLRTFDIQGATDTMAYSINDNGIITGEYWTVQGYHGFIRAADGTITTFDVPDSDNYFGTAASQINTKGDVTGYYGDNTGIHGFIRAADGTITTFDDPKCWYVDNRGIITYNTWAFVLNNKGEVAGYCFLPIKRRVRFIGFTRKPNGTVHEFSVPGGRSETFVSGITDAGVIAGYYNNGYLGYLRFP